MFPLTEMVTSEQLERQKAGALDRVKRAETLERLMKNRDFRSIIIDDFCKDECVRNVELSGDSRASAADRADALAIAQSAGHLRRFFFAVQAMGNMARNEIIAIDGQLEEIRLENDDGGTVGMSVAVESDGEAGSLS